MRSQLISKICSKSNYYQLSARSKGYNFIEQMVVCSYMYIISVISPIRIWYYEYGRAWSGYHTRVCRAGLASYQGV